MGCSRKQWQEQFRCRSFGLGHSDPSVFVKFEWGCPKAYLIWRGIVAAYHVAMVILTGFLNRDTWTRTEVDYVKWFIYLTHWAYLVLTIGTIIDFLSVLYTVVSRPDVVKGETKQLPLYLKVSWVWQNLSNNASILVSLLYWGLLYTPGASISDIDMITHLGNVVYVFINFFITASPVRFYHFFHTIIFGAVYIVFTAIYWSAGGTNGLGFAFVYSVLNWSAPGTATLYSFLSVCVGVPVIQFVLMLLYLLRVSLYDMCLKGRNTGGEDMPLNSIKHS